MTFHYQAGVLECPIVTPASAAIELAVVVPTVNERGNVCDVITLIDQALAGVEWELIFVDDNSADETAECIRRIAATDRRIRVLERIGRRGLASACIEGMLSTPASYIAIMDADLQHDERILTEMLRLIKAEKNDIVVASRYVSGGSVEGLSPERVWLSALGSRIARLACRCELSDPMSGFFLVDRLFFQKVVHRLTARGFKLLLDLLASSPVPARVTEVPYHFRPRRAGESKLDVRVELEYLYFVADKSIGRLVPTRFALFAFIGAIGLIVHFLALASLYYWVKISFTLAQTIGTFAAMNANFVLNNVVTFRDRRLRGWRLATGLVTFSLACSIGVIVNISFARFLLVFGVPWYLAGISGLAVSSVWNYGVNLVLTWRGRSSH
jgi:dolichol-phosphate mannosyltransferase